MTTNRKLLLLSAGSLVGQNLTQALGERRALFELIVTNSAVTEPFLKEFDQVHLVPPTGTDPAALETKMLAIMAEAKPDLVVPCRDEDVLFLAQMGEKHPDLAPRLLVGSSEMASVMLDKWKSWQFCHKHDLPFVPTALASDEAAVRSLVAACGYPLLVKPRGGFASRHVAIVLQEAQLRNVMGDEGFLVQKYIGSVEPMRSYLKAIESGGLPLFHSFEADKVSIQAFIDRAGVVQSVFATIHVMKSGVSVAATREPDPQATELGKRCAHVFAKAGWVGPLNIQCARDEAGQLHIFEFNGRFTGATASRIHLGCDEVGTAFNSFVPGKAIALVERQNGVRAVRQHVVRSLDPAWMETLSKSGFCKN
jgi:carbamoylphosphate synthase large subunit